MDLSVVIPTLNEAATLPALLDDLRRQRDLTLEVIVADGGSEDGTRELATQNGATLVRARRTCCSCTPTRNWRAPRNCARRSMRCGRCRRAAPGTLRSNSRAPTTAT